MMISPSAAVTSPGTSVSAAPRMGSCTVTSLVPSGNVALDLHVVDHRGDPVHHLVGFDHVGAGLHQLGDGAPVARALDDGIGDEGDRLGVVQLDAARESLARDLGGHGDEELVLLAGGQLHRGLGSRTIG